MIAALVETLIIGAASEFWTRFVFIGSLGIGTRDGRWFTRAEAERLVGAAEVILDG